MASNPILSELEDGDVAKLIAAGKVRRLVVGEEIIREGVETPSLFILLSGKLSVTAGKPPKQLAELYPGELVGEMAFVDQRSSSAVVKCVEAGEVLAIPRDAVEAMMLNDPAMGARFFRGIARLVVRRLRSTIMHLGYGQSEPGSPHVQIDRRLLKALEGRGAMAGAR